MNQKASPAALASARMTDAPPQDAVDIGAPAGEALPACVLLVEDDLVSQRVARRHLEQMGYVVVVADDGAAAVETCMQQQFALVLMDLQMAHMDGLQATREIRRLEGRSRRVPILGLTANAGADELARCTTAGMNGLLVKPLQRTRLAQALEQLASADQALAPPDPEPHEHADPASALPADLANLRAKFRDDSAFVRRLCQTFLTSTRQLMNELERAAYAGDRAQLRALAHKIKGASNNVYAHRAAALAAQIEWGSTGLTVSALNPAIEALRRAIDEIATQVSSELP